MFVESLAAPHNNVCSGQSSQRKNSPPPGCTHTRSSLTSTISPTQSFRMLRARKRLSKISCLDGENCESVLDVIVPPRTSAISQVPAPAVDHTSSVSLQGVLAGCSELDKHARMSLHLQQVKQPTANEVQTRTSTLVGPHSGRGLGRRRTLIKLGASQTHFCRRPRSSPRGPTLSILHGMPPPGLRVQKSRGPLCNQVPHFRSLVRRYGPVRTRSCLTVRVGFRPLATSISSAVPISLDSFGYGACFLSQFAFSPAHLVRSVVVFLGHVDVGVYSIREVSAAKLRWI